MKGVLPHTPADDSPRRERIQRVRDFLKVLDQCSGQKMIASTGAATVLWTEDLREVLVTIAVAQELLTRAKERGELSKTEVASVVPSESTASSEYICPKCGVRHICPTDHERVNW